jgi:hypothetical protein
MKGLRRNDAEERTNAGIKNSLRLQFINVNYRLAIIDD